MTDEIRRALDARLAALEGSEARRARIRARVKEMDGEEQPQVKRKLSVGLALAAALLIALGGMAVAEMARLNLFGYFAGKDFTDNPHWEQDQIKWSSLQDKGTLIASSGSGLDESVLKEVIQIHDAYYDGDVLFVGFISGNFRGATAAWTPTEEELSTPRQKNTESTPLTYAKEPIYEQERPVIEAFHQAVKEREPYGFIRYDCNWNFFDMETAEGHKLWRGMTFYTEMVDDRFVYAVMQVASPLPEEIRQQDEISVRLPFTVKATYHWFDGTDLYVWRAEKKTAMLTADIGRDENAPRRRYKSGTVVMDGVNVQVDAEASPYLLHVTLQAESPVFQQTDDGDEWRWSVCDETGRGINAALKAAVFRRTDGTEQQFTFYETYSQDGLSGESWRELAGDLPEKLMLTFSKNGAEDVTVTLEASE